MSRHSPLVGAGRYHWSSAQHLKGSTLGNRACKERDARGGLCERHLGEVELRGRENRKFQFAAVAIIRASARRPGLRCPGQ